jgi:transcriptional regulator with XRE-family HTH domain
MIIIDRKPVHPIGVPMRPTVRSRRLGAKIRYYRDEARLDQTEAARAINIKQAQMSNVESGKARITPENLKTLARLLDIPPDAAIRMEELRARAAIPGWWEKYSDILSEPMQALVELEAEASWIRTYEGQVIPGLLQTKEYAERIISAGSAHARVGDIDRMLELRLRRQQRLESPDFQLTAVVSEMVIRQQIGGPDVLRDQLTYLVRATREHNVTVQVVPFAADAHAALCDQFIIIQWPAEDDPEAVYVDGLTSWRIHESNPEIRQYNHAFASVQTRALSPRASIRLINGAIKELST